VSSGCNDDEGDDDERNSHDFAPCELLTIWPSRRTGCRRARRDLIRAESHGRTRWSHCRRNRLPPLSHLPASFKDRRGVVNHIRSLPLTRRRSSSIFGPRIPRPGHRATLPHAATQWEKLTFIRKGWGASPNKWRSHHDAQDSDWFGRRGDRHSRFDVKCVRH
jgi:hypothetical protein